MGAEDKIGLQLAGIEFLPPDLFLDDAETIRHLMEAADSGQFDPAQLPFPKLPIRQVFADPQGDHYLVIPTIGDSPVALPYITSSELGTLADMRQGGFMPVDALSKVASPESLASGFPDPVALMGQLTTGIVDSVAKGGSVTGAILGQLQSQLTDLALSQVPEEFRGIAKQAVSKGLEYAPKLLDGLMSGDLGGAMKNPLTNMSMDDVTGIAVGGLTDMGFSALTDAWKVDDDSSTLEHVAHQYGMQALGMIKEDITKQMQSFVKDALSGQLGIAMDNLSNGFGNSLEGLGKWFDLFFNGMNSAAILPAAHKDSKDDKVDIVITGFSTVLVEGKPISRITDLLDPSKKIILEGAATVLAGGMPVGRVTSDTAIPSDLLTGAATVLIGGPSVKISPPIVPKGGARGGAGDGQPSGGGASKEDIGSSGNGNREGGEKKEDQGSGNGNREGGEKKEDQGSGNGNREGGEKKEGQSPPQQEELLFEKVQDKVLQKIPDIINDKIPSETKEAFDKKIRELIGGKLSIEKKLKDLSEKISDYNLSNDEWSDLKKKYDKLKFEGDKVQANISETQRLFYKNTLIKKGLDILDKGISGADSLNTLLEGDQEVQELARQGDIRGGYGKMWETLGRVGGSVIGDVVSLGGKFKIGKEIVASIGIEEGSAWLGQKVGDFSGYIIFDIFQVPDRRKPKNRTKI